MSRPEGPGASEAAPARFRVQGLDSRVRLRDLLWIG